MIGVSRGGNDQRTKLQGQQMGDMGYGQQMGDMGHGQQMGDMVGKVASEVDGNWELGMVIAANDRGALL